MFCDNDETTLPALHFFGLEDRLNPFQKCVSARITKSYEKESVVSSRLKEVYIREIQILSDEKTS